MPNNDRPLFILERRKEEEEEKLAPLFKLQKRSEVHPLFKLERKTPTGLPSLVKPEPYIPQHREDAKHVSAAERFSKRFAEYALPFGGYDPDLPDPEGFGETLAGALGGAAGFVIGAWPIAAVTGGFSIPLSMASKVSSASKALTTAYKVGGKKMWDRTARALVSASRAERRLEPEMIMAGKGLLGRSGAYRRMLQNVAKGGPSSVKWAKAMDLGLRNFITFATYGQTHMKPDSPMEERFSQLQSDAIISTLFTGIASPSSVIFHGTTGLKKAAIVGIESFAMFGMGAYSDMGDSDMSWEERLAHGLTLSAMHGVMKGLDREGIKSQQMETLTQHGISNQQAYRLVYKFGISDAIIDGVNKVAKNDAGLFVDKKFYSQPGAELGDHLVRIVREVKKPKKGSPRIMYEKFYGKEVGDAYEMRAIRAHSIEAQTIEQARRQFNKKYINLRVQGTAVEDRIPVPEGLTGEQIARRKKLYSDAGKIKKVVVEGVKRDFIIEDTGKPKTGVKGGKVTPKEVRQLTVEESLLDDIKRQENLVKNLRTQIKQGARPNFEPSALEDLSRTPSNVTHAVLKMSVSGRKPLQWQVDQDIKNIKIQVEKLNKMKKDFKDISSEEKISISDKSILPDLEKGDWVRIPLVEGVKELTKDALDEGRYPPGATPMKPSPIPPKYTEAEYRILGETFEYSAGESLAAAEATVRGNIGSISNRSSSVGQFIGTLYDVINHFKGLEDIGKIDFKLEDIVRLDIRSPKIRGEVSTNDPGKWESGVPEADWSIYYEAEINRMSNVYVFKTLEGGPGVRARYVALHKNQVRSRESNLPYDADNASKLAEEFSINFGKPYKINLKTMGKGKESFRKYGNPDLIDQNLAEGFDTYSDAIQWGNKNWKSSSETDVLLNKLVKNKVNAANEIKGTPEFEQWKKDFKGTTVLMDFAEMSSKSDAGKDFIKMYFPENKTGDIKLLNSEELRTLRMQIPESLAIDVLPGEPGSVYPVNLMSAIKDKPLRRWIHLYSGLLANHTIFDGGGVGMKTLSKLMKGHSLSHRSIMGLSQMTTKEIAKVIKRKDWKHIAILMDEKFASIRADNFDDFLKQYSEKVKYKDPFTGKRSVMTQSDFAKRILRDHFDMESVEKARAIAEVTNSETGKNVPYLEIRDRYNDIIRVDRIAPDVTWRKPSIVNIEKRLAEGKISVQEAKKLRRKALKARPELEVDKPIHKVILDILKGERKEGDKVRILVGYNEKTGQYKYKDVVIDAVVSNQHNPDYFPRLITDEFFEAFKSNENFRRSAIKEILAKHPELNKIEEFTIPGPEGKAIKLKGEEARLMAAEFMMKDLQNTYKNNRVYGQEHTRLANLDPYMYFNDKGVRIIPNTLVDRAGNPLTEGQSVNLLDGGKSKVGKVIKVYETDFGDIMSRHAERSARYVASYKWFGGAKGMVEGVVPKMITLMRREIKDPKLADWYEQYAKRVIGDMVFGQDTSNRGPAGRLFAEGVKKFTRTSASIGLSFPISGFKNLMLGQIQLATHFHMRDLFKTYYDLLVNPEYRIQMNDFATQIGAKYTGTYDLFLSKALPLRALQWTGGMKATEMTNRVISVAMAKRSLDLHLDNLLGRARKILAPSKSQSRHVLQEVFDFTPAEITRMLDIRELHGRRVQQASFNPGYTMDQLRQTADRAHTITQGVGDYPYVPYWMGKDWARPLTLFYRIAYRMTNNIANNVIKPAVNDGNIVPMMKYVGLSMGAGSTLYSVYHHLFGEERRNRFKDAPARYWSNFVRAEGLGVFSNAFDEYGDTFADVYTPVILRNFQTLTKESLNIAEGIKIFAEGDVGVGARAAGRSLNDLLKNTVALYGGTMRGIQNAIGWKKKRVMESKRRQRQFNDAYFPDWDSPIDGDDALTSRTPYYRAIRDVFWHDDAESKARQYYTALAYVTNQLQRHDSALAKNDRSAEKEAKSILKSIITKLRPIPNSWRKRGKGERISKYNLFISKLNDADTSEETELDNMYRTNKSDFWRAVSEYRRKYYWR